MDMIPQLMEGSSAYAGVTNFSIITNNSSSVTGATAAEATQPLSSSSSSSPSANSSRYENQKRRDWNTFGQYLRNHRPPLSLSRCSGAHVLEFLRYLDQFGKTKVHANVCHFYGHPNPPAPCPCPLRQAWGSLDALIGRLRAAFEENGGKPETNPFGARAVRLYLREVRDMQSKARGVSYEKKKRKRPLPLPPSSASSSSAVATHQQFQMQPARVTGVRRSSDIEVIKSLRNVLMLVKVSEGTEPLSNVESFSPKTVSQSCNVCQ